MVNSRITLVYTLLLLLLNFLSRKIFLDSLSDELMGLNTSLTNIIQFLNIAEAGISFAISAFLYRSYTNSNIDEINEIVSFQGVLYKKIGTAIILLGFVTMCFFPLIFAKADIIWYFPYLAFSVILLNSFLFYFFNYRQIVLVASQNTYKIKYSYQSMLAIKLIVQMIAVTYLPNKYLVWLALELIFAILASLALNICIKHSAPYLRKVNKPYSYFKEKYPLILTKIKQLIYHKIGLFSLQQTTPLIVYGFASLSVVTRYFNYYLIFLAGTDILRSIMESLTGSVGNLVNSADKKKIVNVFYELFSLQFIVSAILASAGYYFTTPIVTLWLGAEYTMPASIVTLMLIWMFIMATRNVTDIFLNAYGCFGDIWAPVAEVILNIMLSILLGLEYGLFGIVLGMVVSEFLIVFLWKPFFLYYKALHIKFLEYLRTLALHLALGAAAFFAVSAIPNPEYASSGVVHFLINASAYVAAYSAILYVLMSLFIGSIKRINHRISDFTASKFKK